MSKKVKTALRITALVVLAALIGFGVYSINAQRLGGNTLPMPLGFGATVVLSGSMEPELSVGDLLIVVEADSYQERDVVVYQSGGTAVVHRIIAVDGDVITTQGDANNSPDDPITQANIKGVVVLAIPLAGYLVQAIKSPIGTLVLLGLAILLLEMSFRKDKKKDQQQIDEIRREIDRLKQGNKPSP